MLRDVPPAATNSSSADDDWLEAAHALAGMRIVQPAPPAAQDGGAYERSLADARPVSTATASAAAAAHALDGPRGPLDPVLIACLENPRERLTLLKFEDQIVRFLKTPRELQLIFPPLSSYHRLIIHRLADRCGLEHQTAEYSPYVPGAAYDGNAPRAVTLLKTMESVVPSVLLIDLSTDRQQQQTVAPAVVPKIMVRKRAAPRPGANGGRGGPGDAKNAQRSMQDRERAYAEARARIFGEDASASTTADSASSSSSSTVSPNASAAGATSTGSGGGAVKTTGTSQQAAGPDGSRGFGGRGGRGGGASSSSLQHQQHTARGSEPTNRTAADSLGATNESSSSAATAASATPRVQSAHNWKESKVLWRNRTQELNDPDFTRHRDAYRPSRTGGDSRYVLPHQVAGTRYPPAPPVEYYDSPQQQQQRHQYGYQQQQQPQPPLPGRRYQAGGDFNRLDTGVRSPPPPEHFRNPGAAAGSRFPMSNMPVPPQLGAGGVGAARGGTYSGGGYTSPHSRQFPTSNPSSVRSGSAAGYNADFPPLGK